MRAVDCLSIYLLPEAGDARDLCGLRAGLPLLQATLGMLCVSTYNVLGTMRVFFHSPVLACDSLEWIRVSHCTRKDAEAQGFTLSLSLF